MIYDIIIVGAGPSGAYLGYLLSKEGFNVKIIDKENFPRDKVCGGGISNKTVELLDFDISPIIQKNIIGAFLSYDNKFMIIKDIEGRSGVTVLRRDFDNFILQKAINNGAEFLPNCAFKVGIENDGKVIVETGCGTFESKYLVGADGVYSQVRNKILGNDIVSYAPAMEALVYVEPEIIEKFQNRTLLDFNGAKKGYGWIFPKKDHLNVGVFSIFKLKNIKDELNKFISLYKSLNDYSKIEYKGFSIPLKNKNKIFEKGNIWLIGDAAGFAESFYGEGIYFALKSAKVAAEAMVKAFKSNRKLIYTKLVKQKMLEDLFYSELNTKLFYPFQKFGYFSMVRNKHVNNYFAEIITGKVSNKECFYKTIFTSPYWLFSKKYDYVKGYDL